MAENKGIPKGNRSRVMTPHEEWDRAWDWASSVDFSAVNGKAVEAAKVLVAFAAMSPELQAGVLEIARSIASDETPKDEKEMALHTLADAFDYYPPLVSESK